MVSRTIDVPGASIGMDNGAVNTHGEIVGLYCDSEPCTSRSLDTHGFLINLIESRSIDVPGAASTVVFSINTRGAIVGVVPRHERQGSWLCARSP